MEQSCRPVSLLASVTDQSEARLCASLGADIIDAKNPALGALGALPGETVRAIRASLPTHVPVSATIGDPADDPEAVARAVHLMAAAGADVVKVGFRAEVASEKTLRRLSRLALGRVRLVAVLLVLGAFRLGQMQHRYRLPAVNGSISGKAKPAAPKVDASPARAETPAPVRETAAPDTGGVTAAATVEQGDHVIVLAQYPKQDDLVPVKEYFGQHGINTEILAVDKLRDYLAQQGMNTSVLGNKGGFMLVASYYDNPENPGTDGYKAKQRIKELGRGYKAPSGSESFAPKFFSDAYGMKVR